VHWTVTHRVAALAQTSIGEWYDRIYLAPGAIVPMAMVPMGGGEEHAAIGAFKTVLRWNPLSKVTTTLGSHAASIRAMEVLSNGLLATADYKGVVKLWDPVNNRSASGQVHHQAVTSITALTAGRFVTVGADGRVVLWQSSTSGGNVALSPVKIVADVASGLHQVLALSGSRIAYAGQDRTVTIQDVDTHATQIMGDHTDSIRSLIALSDGRLVSGNAGGKIIVWDPATDERTPFYGHTDVVSDLRLLEDDRFVSGGYDGAVLLWSVAKSEPTALVKHDTRVLSVEQLPDGRFVSTDEAGVVRLTVADEEISDAVGEHTGPVVNSLALPDGRLLTASEDGTLRVWSPVTNEQTTLADMSRAYGSDGQEQAFQPDCVIPLEAFNHIGFLGVGESYSRSDTDLLAGGRAGRFYAGGKTGNLSSKLNVDPFEFIYKANNIDLSEPFIIRLADDPDLAVTDVTIPSVAEEGAIVDISWTVANVGSKTDNERF
jgi:WD40 repeat protein